MPLTVKLYCTEPSLLLNDTRLEFTVSTEDSGLEYNSKYQMMIEGRHGTKKKNASSTFPLSKYLLLLVGKFEAPFLV